MEFDTPLPDELFRKVIPILSKGSVYRVSFLPERKKGFDREDARIEGSEPSN